MWFEFQSRSRLAFMEDLWFSYWFLVRRPGMWHKSSIWSSVQLRIRNPSRSHKLQSLWLHRCRVLLSSRSWHFLLWMCWLGQRRFGCTRLDIHRSLQKFQPNLVGENKAHSTLDEKGMSNLLHLSLWWYELNLHLLKHRWRCEPSWLRNNVLSLKWNSVIPSVLNKPLKLILWHRCNFRYKPTTTW
jgi:hypothetical protein